MGCLSDGVAVRYLQLSSPWIHVGYDKWNLMFKEMFTFSQVRLKTTVTCSCTLKENLFPPRQTVQHKIQMNLFFFFVLLSHKETPLREPKKKGILFVNVGNEKKLL